MVNTNKGLEGHDTGDRAGGVGLVQEDLLEGGGGDQRALSAQRQSSSVLGSPEKRP